MRSLIVLAVTITVTVTACSGGSGVDSGKTVPQLSDPDYTSLCTYYNSKAKELVGKQCDGTMITQVNTIPCGSTNVLSGSTCAARVADVEACVNSMNACVVTGKDRPSGQCLIVDNCFPKR